MSITIIEWLKDARLVARIQESFGIRIHYMKSSSQDDSKESVQKCMNNVSREIETDTCKKTNFCEKKEVNGFILTERKVNGAENLNKTLTETLASDVDLQNSHFTITNYFWYYLFLLGTELGDELFYSTFFPFWFWNIDSAVGRRVILVWCTIMSIGQILKDVICWPRPNCPPAVRLQVKWSQEYGMPSTHAMVGVSIPFSVILYTMNRYIYPVSIGWTIACLWCAVVTISRLYLGMHTVLDILAGLLLSFLLMIPLVPIIDFTDYYIISNGWALAILVTITIATVIYYPTGKTWTPTRGDTTMVVSVTAGVHVGAWLNYLAGVVSAPTIPPPYKIFWPSYMEISRLIFRTVLGFASVLATKVICKFLVYTTICAILNENSKELMRSKEYSRNKNKTLVDLVYKYVSCFMIGVNTVYFLPSIFKMVGIERSTFYTEI